MIPTFGSKEAVFLLAQVLDGDVVLVPQPAYPVYERGALFAGKQVVELPLRGPRASCPTSTRDPGDVLARTAILWLNYPNNPTAATAPLELYERAAALAREHDFVLASDEAYSEIYFGASRPPRRCRSPTARTSRSSTRCPSARRCPATARASSPATRSSIAALKRYRPNVGVAPPEFVQRAAAAAWSDEAARGRRARASTAPSATCWCRRWRPAGCATRAATRRSSCGSRAPRPACTSACSSRGSSSPPATTSARPAPGYLRLALVPTLAQCERAAELLVGM